MTGESHDISVRYQRTDEAARYARRQTLGGSPAEWLVGRLEIREIDRALRRLDATRDGRVLDIAAGTGKLTALLTRRFDRYVASDLSAAMLGHIGGGVARCQGDATRLPFRDHAGEIAVCLRLLHRLPIEVAASCVAELLRVAPAGVVVSYGSNAAWSTLYRRARRLARRPTLPGLAPVSPQDFATLVAKAGGAVVTDRSISGGLTSERIAAIRSVRAPARHG